MFYITQFKNVKEYDTFRYGGEWYQRLAGGNWARKCRADRADYKFKNEDYVGRVSPTLD